MGRLDNQQQEKQVGRLPREVVTAEQEVDTIKTPPSRGNFITNAPSNLGALFRGEVSVGDVAREIPGTALRGSIKTADVVTPALSNFVRTTGGIIGEGLAYASSKDVREQYKAGNLDILPTVTKTTQGGLLKDTVAAALEATIIRSVPAAMKGKLVTRAGIGGLEGIGFAITEGLAKDQTEEEIIKNAKLYGVSGAALNVVLPWLGPLLRKELSKAPQGLKQALKEEVETGVSAVTKTETPSPAAAVPETPSPTAAVPGRTAQAPGVQAVQGEQIPIGGPTKGASRLEARLVKQVEDPTYQSGLDNYARYSNKADAPEITGSSNPEQIKRAAQAVDNLTPLQINDIVNGTAELPPGVLRTAFIKAATEKALLAGDSALVNRLARSVGQAARRFGQEIQFTKNFDPLDPTYNIADILSVRLKAAERRIGKGETATNYIRKNVKAAQKESLKSQIKIKEAESLIDSILC